MKNSLLISGIVLIFSCTESKNYSKADSSSSVDSCKIFYTDDRQSEVLFKNIFSGKYNNTLDRVKNRKPEISKIRIKNNSDSTIIDSIITIKTENIFLKYYSRTNSKVLLVATVTNNDIQLIADVSIGMPYHDFLNRIIKNYFETEIQKVYNCIDITTQSEYDNFHFLFKNGKLATIEYTTKVESFE